MKSSQFLVDPYVDVVTARITLLTKQMTLNTLQLVEMLSAVQPVQALGGGWDRGQLPTPAQMSAKVPNSAYKMQN